MFVTNVAVIIAGLVLVAQVNADCSCTCSGGGVEVIGGGSWGTNDCGLGPGVDMCHRHKGPYNWGIGGTLGGSYDGALTGGVSGIIGLATAGNINIDGTINSYSHAPIVVRPQEIPKPPIALPVSLAPVAGPCVCKKAIVKPAVLPKPVCHAQTKFIGGGIGVGGIYGATTTTNNIHHHQTTSTVVGTSVPVGAAVIGGGVGGPIVLEKDVVYGNAQAQLTPADPVSLCLAYQNAQKSSHVPVEDRLTFGFRKIPEEIPRAIIIKKNIPEEQIFNLNGQVVELKPVQPCSHKTLEEEAQEELLDLQEEETSVHAAGVRRVSLGELGYAPAKIDKKKFVDVPSGTVGRVVHGVAQAVSGALGGRSTGSLGSAIGRALGSAGTIGSTLGASGYAHESLGSVAGGALGAAASALGHLLGHKKSSRPDGFVSGNVVYKTVPKQSEQSQGGNSQLEVAEDNSECQSQEAGEEQSVAYNHQHGAAGVSCGVCCRPCCTSHSYHSSSSVTGKKASVLVQRLVN